MRGCWGSVAWIAAAAMAAGAGFGPGFGAPRAAIATPSDLDLAVRSVRPAVVRVETRATATVVSRAFDLDSDAIRRFAEQRTGAYVADGRAFASTDELVAVVYRDFAAAFADNASAFVRLTDEVRDPYEFRRVGSGTIVSADGAIVTTTDALLTGPEVEEAARHDVATDIEVALAEFAPDILGDASIPDDAVANVTDAISAMVKPTLRIEDVHIDTFVQFGDATAGDHDGPRVRRADIVWRSPTNGNGLAVVDIEGRGWGPLAFASDASARRQRDVTVVGYPAKDVEATDLDDGEVQRPTAVTGRLTGTVRHAVAFDGIFTAGASGGPAIGRGGDVVGIGVRTPGTSAVAGPVEVAAALRAARLHPVANGAMASFRDGVSDLARHYYGRALRELRRAGALAPDAPYIADEAQFALSEIALGRDETPTPRPVWPMAFAAVLVLAAAAATGVHAARARRAGAPRVTRVP